MPSLSSTKKTTVNNRSLERALSILSLFDRENPSMTFTQIWNETGLSKATALRLLSTLTAEGFLAYDAQSRLYTLGEELITLGFVALRTQDLTRTSYPIMEQLQQLTNQTITLYVRRGMNKTCILKIDSNDELRLTPNVGRLLPGWLGASGLVLLSDFTPEELRRILAGATGSEQPNAEQIIKDIQLVKRDGYICTKNQRQPGAGGMGTPIFANDGRIIASLNISGREESFTKENIQTWKSPLVIAGRKISRHMGYSEH